MYSFRLSRAGLPVVRLKVMLWGQRDVRQYSQSCSANKEVETGMNPRSCISKCLTIPSPWHCPLDTNIFSNRGSVCEHSNGNQSQSIHKPPVVSWSGWGRWWWWCLTSYPFVVVQLLSCVWLCNPMELPHARLTCPSPSPRVCTNSCPLSGWYNPTISSSVAPFSSCLQFFPASVSFLMSWLFASGGQSIGASALASVLPVNIRGWFPAPLEFFKERGPQMASFEAKIQFCSRHDASWAVGKYHLYSPLLNSEQAVLV